MEKLTDKDIIKALKQCGQHRECCYCNSLEECGNKRVLTASVLDLINRQQAEIERLNAVSEICGECHQKYAEKIAKAKSEAIKEFAERLKDIFTAIDGTFECWEVEGHIDNLVAEMAGE